MDKIRALYINKKIISFLDEKRKLDLIKYNKSLQNKINFNIINYKLFSNRYIIYGDNGINKEYNNDNQLIYKGQYSNGKRKG